MKEPEFSKERMERLSTRLREMRKKRKKEKRFFKPDPPPLYDEVFFQGLQELEEREGGILQGQGIKCILFTQLPKE